MGTQCVHRVIHELDTRVSLGAQCSSVDRWDQLPPLIGGREPGSEPRIGAEPYGKGQPMRPMRHWLTSKVLATHASASHGEVQNRHPREQVV